MGRLDMLQKFVQWFDEDNITSFAADEKMRELIEEKGKEYVSHIAFLLINENTDSEIDCNDIETVSEWIEAHR